MIIGKKIAIYGLGVEGVASINYLGEQNTITVFDDKDKKEIDKELFDKVKVEGVNYLLGKSEVSGEKFDLVLRSAGIRPDNQRLVAIADKSPITSATNVFFEECPSFAVGVTGTKGKGTTSTLIFNILKESKHDVYLAGNIGTPMLEVLPNLKKESIVVLELSSFQLMDLKKSPNISVVLMITSEHLDWHKDQAEYATAKESIVKYQKESDSSVINEDFPTSKSFANKTKSQVVFFSTTKEANGTYIEGDDIVSNISGREVVMKTMDVLLPGRHNLQNVCAAVAVAKILKVENQTIQNAVKNFKGLKHRLELIASIDGVRYYNDSFSTTPETTIAAIEAFSEPKILILGGSSKKSDFKELAKKLASATSLKKIILIGEESERIKKELTIEEFDTSLLIEGAKDIESIISIAIANSQQGDIVLLSPACASFDMFKNYKDRGDKFRKEVLKHARK